MPLSPILKMILAVIGFKSHHNHNKKSPAKQPPILRPSFAEEKKAATDIIIWRRGSVVVLHFEMHSPIPIATVRVKFIIRRWLDRDATRHEARLGKIGARPNRDPLGFVPLSAFYIKQGF
jgi:hypothetical protein